MVQENDEVGTPVLGGPTEERIQRFMPWSIGIGYLFAYYFLLGTAQTVMKLFLFYGSLGKSKAAKFWETESIWCEENSSLPY